MQRKQILPVNGVKKAILFLCLAMVSFFCATGCFSLPRSETQCERAAIVFGTTARLSAKGDKAEAAVAACMERLDTLDRLFDADAADMPLAKLRDAAGSEVWVALPPEIWHVLSVSQKYSELTDGAWDVTIAPLSALWRKAIADGAPPAESDIAAARQNIGWRKLELRATDQSARLTDAGMALDLGGVRKGFALDECRRIYEAHHVTGLIDLGESSIAAVGGKNDGAPFRIALRHPREPAPTSLGVLWMKNAALSSSGDYEHFFLHNGVRYHHILDPRTGFPVQNGVTAVFVRIAADEADAGIISDILSTALFAAGPEQGLALLSALPAHAEAAFANETELFARTIGFDTK